MKLCNKIKETEVFKARYDQIAWVGVVFIETIQRRSGLHNFSSMNILYYMLTMVSNSDVEYSSSIKKKVRVKIITKREYMPKNMTAKKKFIYIFL